MTKYEWIKQANKEEIARMFCDMTDSLLTAASGCSCMDCPVSDRCGLLSSHENGYVPWLDEEVKYNDAGGETFCEIKIFDE